MPSVRKSPGLEPIDAQNASRSLTGFPLFWSRPPRIDRKGARYISRDMAWPFHEPQQGCGG